MNRCAYSRASWVFPTPPSPYSACGDHHGPAAPGELVAQHLQHGAAPGEVGVPGRDIPDRRDRAGESRFPGLGGHAADWLRGPVQGPEQLGGRLGGVQPGQVNDGMRR